MSLFNNLKHYEPEQAGSIDFEDVVYILQPDGSTKTVEVPDDTEVESDASNS